jgi:hypothetical protein
MTLGEGGRSGHGPKCLYRTISGVEGYWGKTGANLGQKSNITPESPPKPPQNPPKQKWGGVGVSDSVAAICHTTRTPQVHPQKFLFKPTPLPFCVGTAIPSESSQNFLDSQKLGLWETTRENKTSLYEHLRMLLEACPQWMLQETSPKWQFCHAHDSLISKKSLLITIVK